MQITDIRIRQSSDEGKLRAKVSITIDDAFAVHEIKVLEGDSGLFIAMPSKKLPNGEYKDIAHPINQETRTVIQDMIIEAYLKKMAEEKSSSIEA